MYDVAQLRIKRSKNNETERSDSKDIKSLSGPLYLGRPKSWGEYQSGLTAFRSVSHPRKSTTPIVYSSTDETKSHRKRMDDEKVVRRGSTTLEITKARQPTKSDAFRCRPLSDLLMPTPFMKQQRNPMSLDTMCGSYKSTNSDHKFKSMTGKQPGYLPNLPTTCISEKKKGNLGLPSVVYEEALHYEKPISNIIDWEIKTQTKVDFKSNAYLSSLTAIDNDASNVIGNTEKNLKPRLAYDKPMPEGATPGLDLQRSGSIEDTNSCSVFQNIRQSAKFEPSLVVNQQLIESDSKELEELLQDRCSVSTVTDSSSDSAIGTSESFLRKRPKNLNCLSKASSIVDTKLYLLEGGNNINIKPNSPQPCSLLSDQEEKRMHNVHLTTPSTFPRKSRGVISPPLRSCYSNPTYSPEKMHEDRRESYSRSSISKSSFSSSSLDVSDEESFFTTLNPNDFQESNNYALSGGHNKNRATAIPHQPRRETKLPIPKTRFVNGFSRITKQDVNPNKSRIESNYGSKGKVQRHIIQSAAVKKKEVATTTISQKSTKDSDTDSLGSGSTKGILRNSNNNNVNICKVKSVSIESEEYKLKNYEISSGSTNAATLEKQSYTIRPVTTQNLLPGCKDDESSRIGRSLTGDLPEDFPVHGTWPRRKQKSKRKQDQEETEELMRRFRSTSETYRNRFRSIYADSRRKIEETIFGLRVAVAKNGYSAKYYQPKRSDLV